MAALDVVVGPDPAEIHLKWYDGDTLAFTFLFKNPDGTPIDMSASSYIAQVAPRLRGTGSWDFVIDVSSAAAGTLLITPPTDAEVPNEGKWDLREVSGGQIIRTLAVGHTTKVDTVSRLP